MVLISSRAKKKAAEKGERQLITPEDLQKIFHVVDHQHEIVLEAEKKNPYPESILRELRLRLVTIDNHPFYNKDSFIVSPLVLLFFSLSRFHSSRFFFLNSKKRVLFSNGRRGKRTRSRSSWNC